MCSTTRGPAICPSLSDMTDKRHHRALTLAKRMSSWTQARTCVHRAGRRQRVPTTVSRWRIDDDNVRPVSLQGREDVAQRRRRCEGDRFSDRPRRCAQTRIWAVASSPEISRPWRRHWQGPPQSATARSTCRRLDRRRSAAPNPAPDRRRRRGRDWPLPVKLSARIRRRLFQRREVEDLALAGL